MKVSENIHAIEGRGFDSNMYLVIDDEEKITLIDTGHDARRTYLVKYIENLGMKGTDISRVILTHIHVDHSGGLAWFVDKFNPEVHVFETDADAIEKGDMRMTLASMFKGSFDKTRVDVRLKPGERLSMGKYSFKVLHTPGHSSGSICLWDDITKVLISGDTVFADGSFGRTDFPSGNLGELINSLNSLAELDAEVLLPGHMRWVTGGATKHLKMSAKYIKMLM